MDNVNPGDSALLNIRPFYGPVYIADLLAAAMWSVVCLQTIRYFNKYPHDRIIIKATVALLFALLNLELAFLIYRAYHDFIINFGDRQAAFNTVPEYLYILPISAIMAVYLQSFLTYRVWRFTGRKMIIPVVFVPLAIFELLANIIYVSRILTLRASLGHEVPLLESYLVPEQKLMLAYYSISPAVDITLAGFMGYYLTRKSQETRFTGTAELLHRLAILSINSGIWTTIFAFMTLILAVHFPGTNYYAIPNFPLGALYVNSYLMNLNSRKSLKRHHEPANINASNLFQLGPMSRRDEVMTISAEQGKRRDTFLETSDVEHGRA